MNSTKIDALRAGVDSILTVNMNLRDGQRVLILSDYPASDDWRSMPFPKLKEMSARAALARAMTEIAAEAFPNNRIEFWPYASTGRNNLEPDPDTVARMCETDILLMVNTHTLSHTVARRQATGAGVYVASMPDFEYRMLEPGGPMAIDYRALADSCGRWAAALGEATDVRVATALGTDLRFSIRGRPGHYDGGFYGEDPQQWGNLPAGEAFVLPVEGTGEGWLVAPAGWHPDLQENMSLAFERGAVVAIEGGEAVGDRFRELLRLGSGSEDARHRRNLAEFGIGTNPNASRTDIVIEAEKIKGTVHAAIGDNIGMGGRFASDIHVDFILPEPDVYLDGQAVIQNGEWRT